MESIIEFEGFKRNFGIVMFLFPPNSFKHEYVVVELKVNPVFSFVDTPSRKLIFEFLEGNI